MKHKKQIGRDLSVMIGLLAAAILLSLGLSYVNNDNNPFAPSVFLLAVVLTARFTDGYVYGILASLAGTFCVNYMFTYPFWRIDLTLSGYPLTFVTMLAVSVIISTLTTQIKRQEQLRFEAEREKMHANLLRAIAHDIRTPLASILGASSALKEHEVTEEDRSALLDGINRDANWLVRVTENLLSVTRVSGDNMALKKTDEVLEEIIGSAIIKYHRTPDALRVRVQQPDRILIVPMDGMLIEQVLINLFDNVSAHAETATQIWLKVSCESGMVRISVEDDGTGIPENRLRTLFDGFAHPSDQGQSGNRRSMGIGLSVCRTIVRAHGGDMKAEKSEYGGAAVSLTLPFTEEDHERIDPQ